MFGLCSAVTAKDLATYKALRSYEGAPPTIPHEGHQGLGSLDCLSCHKFGGYVRKLGATAPLSPHPEWTNCVQCHVPVDSDTVFRENEFIRWNHEKKEAVKSVQTSPPVIPHKSYQRQNCLSCHSNSPASVKPTNHPERANCIQCHVYRDFKETKTLEVKKW